MLLLRKVWGQFSGNFIVGKNGGSKASGKLESLNAWRRCWCLCGCEVSLEKLNEQCVSEQSRDVITAHIFFQNPIHFFFSSKQSLMSWICSSFKSKVAFGYPCIRMTGKRQLKFSENFIFWKLFIVYLCASHSPEMEKKKSVSENSKSLYSSGLMFFCICKIGVAQWGGWVFIDYVDVRIKRERENRKRDDGKDLTKKSCDFKQSRWTQSFTPSAMGWGHKWWSKGSQGDPWTH